MSPFMSYFTYLLWYKNCRYDHQGHALASQSLTDRTSAGSGLKVNWKTLSEVKDEKMGHGEKVRRPPGQNYKSNNVVLKTKQQSEGFFLSVSLVVRSKHSPTSNNNLKTNPSEIPNMTMTYVCITSITFHHVYSIFFHFFFPSFVRLSLKKRLRKYFIQTGTRIC